MVLVCCGACEKKANSAYSYCVGAVHINKNAFPIAMSTAFNSALIKYLYFT